jgi:cold shock protein
MTIDTGRKDDEGNPVLEARYGFHSLHAAASLFIQYLKWSPKRLQTVMGHSSVRMTFDLYGHLFDDIERVAPIWRRSRQRSGPPKTPMRHGCDMQENNQIASKGHGGFVNRWSGVQFPHPAPESPYRHLQKFSKVPPDGTLFAACRLWHTEALVIPRRSSMPQGTVKWFNPTKGYGFIQPQEGGKDVFVHISAVERAGLSTLNEGQTVQYELVENRGKTSAENLKVK